MFRGQMPGQWAYIIVTMRTWPLEADKLLVLPSVVVKDASSQVGRDTVAAGWATRVPSDRLRCWIGAQTVIMKIAAATANTDASGTGYRSRELTEILDMLVVPAYGAAPRYKDVPLPESVLVPTNTYFYV